MSDAESSKNDDLESILRDPSAQPCALRLQYLRDITNNFSKEQELGRGGFGVVYKGILPNGKMIAVKNLVETSKVQEKHFKNEVDNLMRLKHKNIVRFIGYCYETYHEYVEYNGIHVFAEKPKRLLCFEYMPNGSLDRYISEESCGLDWPERYKIIKGICYGLHYLHEECQINASIIHLDLKPLNILLDDNMVPKVADFGLSKFFDDTKSQTCATSLVGSYGYMAPEYLCNRIVSTKADIYSLGVIVIEMITGRKSGPFDIESSQDFVEYVITNWRNRLEATRSSTVLEVVCRQIECCLEIGLRCIKINRVERPTSREIIETLNYWETINCYVSDNESPPANKGIDALNASEGAESEEAQTMQSVSSQRSPIGLPDLSSDPKGANLSQPYHTTVHEEPNSLFEEAEDNLLPGVEGLRITGDACPGGELLVSGYPINGCRTCNFQWMRHLEDGSINDIKGAWCPTYLVTADDVDAILAVTVEPLDERKRKGEVVHVFANEESKITCDSETKELIKRTFAVGHVTYPVQLQLSQVSYLDIWEPAVLSITRTGFNIKCSGLNGVLITQRFQKATAVSIPYERPTEFLIKYADGVYYHLKPAENSLCRDTIVLVLRLFKLMAEPVPMIYPQRPGETVCDFYMKTGNCKYSQKCKFHHPINRSAPDSNENGDPQQPVTFTLAGLPRREDAEVCAFYMRTGTCKFGAHCKFDHPPPEEELQAARNEGE